MHNDTSREAAWFYAEDGERHGSLDEAQMVELIRAGRLGRHTPVWKIGDSDWRLLDDSELRPHLDALSPPPLCDRHVDSTLAWVLAFAPLLGYLLEWLLAFALASSAPAVQRAMDEASYWYVTPALNVLLGVLDEKRLQKAGHDTRHFRGWVWLVPVYLYQRARHLRQTPSYFVVWLLAFGLLLLA
ncbi:DUF4339 domain-containing protein [Pseudomonas stutzeri]|nr:DUF4339 domain-containing protein [Stutzerimonas stutzeri]